MTQSRRAVLALLLAAGLGSTARAQNPPPIRLRGSIVARDGDTLTIKTRAGDTVKAALRPDTGIIAVVPASLDDIRKGRFIGTAAMPGPNGTLIALEVHVFPEVMRGLGEGHRPFDLQPESTMTNGTVGDVVVTSGRTLTVAYKGGEKTITVPLDVPIVGLQPTERGFLTVGANVILFATKQDGDTLAATRVLVGKNGLVPPM